MTIKRASLIATTLMAVACVAAAQVPAKTTFIGTVTAANAADGTVQVKVDNGSEVPLKLKPETIVQRVEPGEKDLKNAKPIQATDIAAGDRVLVSVFPETTDARRIIVMAATDIAKRNEADRMDWTRRGVGGVVVTKTGSEITVRTRTFGGERQAVVTVSDKTLFRRYAPDSVKFADAKQSALDEVSVGDQLRARGVKSEDGLKVDAQEVVFGTFVTKAGEIKSVNPEEHEITIQDLATNKPLIIKVSADSQLKRMPDFPGMGGPGMRTGSGSSPAAAPAGNGMRPAGAGPGGGAPGTMGGRPGGGDLAQMLERMPATTIADLKPGQQVVVSSTKGAQSDRITAIMLVANADMLIRMATARSGDGQNRGGMMNGGGGMGMGAGGGGLSGMMGGLEMPGMMP